MKPALLTLTFLLFAFPLAYGQVQQVVDIDGNPVLPGVAYYIVEATSLNSGVKLGQTGISTCPVTVEVYDFDGFGSPVKFSTQSGRVSTDEIFEGNPLDTEFTKTPNCAESSKWRVFVDNYIHQMYVGIGGLKDHPGQEPAAFGIGKSFRIQRSKLGYKFVTCSLILIEAAPTCYNIGKYHECDERASRLILTDPYIEHNAFDFVLIKAVSYSRIKTVV